MFLAEHSHIPTSRKSPYPGGGDLHAIASGAADPKKIRTCIEDEAYASWVKSATERAVTGIAGTDLALTGSPMVIVNGQQYLGDPKDPAEFSQFVLTNASDAFYKSQATPTPTPTVSPTP